MVGAVKVAVVTGASSGIGEAVCSALGARGFHVIGLSRSESPAADEHLACDVSDRQAVDAVAASVLARYPLISVLVNNAGVAARGHFIDTEPERIQQAVATNYLGSVWCLRAFLPGLERGSHVVNIVSVAGSVAIGPYSASKHAQLAFSRSVAVELAPRGISVHTVNPGFVETPGFPQRERFRFPLRLLVVDPPFVAARILHAMETNRHEIVVPRWYRPAGWLQTLAPGLLVRLRTRLPIDDV
jgi:NAD(P)-dependent dehydrogenase (short-subunit alcohol dehydrogenase family)